MCKDEWPEPDSNRHAFGASDFKSDVSAYSTIGPEDEKMHGRGAGITPTYNRKTASLSILPGKLRLGTIVTRPLLACFVLSRSPSLRGGASRRAVWKEPA